MNPKQTTTLFLSLISMVFMGNTASAVTQIHCHNGNTGEPVLTMQFPLPSMNQNGAMVLPSGQRLTIFPDRFSIKIVDEVSRFRGATEVNLEANSTVPDYSLPSVVKFHGVGYNGNLSGQAKTLGLTGFTIKNVLVRCVTKIKNQ